VTPAHAWHVLASLPLVVQARLVLLALLLLGVAVGKALKRWAGPR